MTFVSVKSATLATIFSTVAGIAVYLGLYPFGIFVREMMTYHTVLLVLFTVLYYLAPGGFESHFNVPQLKNVSDKDQKTRFSDVLYYSTVTHASVGYGDIYPLTRGARLTVMLHILLSFMGVANLIVLAVSKR